MMERHREMRMWGHTGHWQSSPAQAGGLQRVAETMGQWLLELICWTTTKPALMSFSICSMTVK